MSENLLESLKDVLNQAWELDNASIHKLISTRVIINDELADSQSPIAVLENPQGECELGPIGLLNGLVSLFDDRRLCAMYNDTSGEMEGFGIVRLAINTENDYQIYFLEDQELPEGFRWF
jgi:hypothetical protein